MWNRFAFAAILAFCCAAASGKEAEKITFRGKVVDINSTPLSGATVRLYEGDSGRVAQEKEVLEIKEEQTTKEDGAFSFVANKDAAGKQIGVVIAEKDGFALGWQFWYPRENQEETITLGEPNEFAGVIIDTNGGPVADAEVGIFTLVWDGMEKTRLRSSLIGTDYLKTRTDREGKFVLRKIPSGAKAEFIVKKAGRATTITYAIQGLNQFKYLTGQGDIKIVMPVESVIEGRVVEQETQKGATGVKIAAYSKAGMPFVLSKPIESNEDGTFRFNELPAGKMILTLSRATDKPQEWVAEPVEVTTEEGKTVSGIEIKVSKGGALEVTIIEAGSKKPIKQAQISVRGSGERQNFAGQSDSNGLARIKLSPGEYVFAGAYHRDYSCEKMPTTITIEEGKTIKATVEMNPVPKIRGVVRDGSGKPVEGAEFCIHPMMNMAVKTDANGRFETAFNRQSWGNRNETFYAVVLAKKENLAWSGPVEEEVNQMEIKLTPTLVYTGKVVDANGAAIEGAKVTLMARFGNYGSQVSDEKITSDKEGRFELKYIPEGLNCSVSAQASGYSKEEIEAEQGNSENGRLDLGEFQLKEALLKVTGIVVDVNDMPVANVNIFSYGQKQPERSGVTTDANGRFTIDKVCDGRLQISAHSSGASEASLYGFAQTEGGATDVKIVISEQGTNRSTPKKPPSITGKSIPPMDGLGIKPGIEDVNDKPLLICFFDVQQKPSRHALKELAAMAAELKEKGITVVGVQSSPIGREALDEQLKNAQVTFAVGMIEQNEEKVKSQWGVEGLPWLILTNKQHIVKASGFDVADISQKLEGLDK